ncbi:MAG TPA: VanZ family protein [Candidatus Polarisedimenticolia bacterium]|nr:VanZ family protein [Candidatus Polarisedimenticolia bacterium]
MDRGKLLHRLAIWGPVAGYLALIFYLSSQSRIPWARLAPDYLEHGVEYAGLAVVLARALNDGLGRPVPRRTLLLTLLLCVAYAATDEIHQRFVPDRYSDIMDVLSDAVGSCLGLIVLHLAQWMRAGGDAA